MIGDNGTGESEQYEIGAQMAKMQTAFPFDFVIMLGDNMYGSQNPRDFVKKFEEPYKALLRRATSSSTRRSATTTTRRTASTSRGT